MKRLAVEIRIAAAFVVALCIGLAVWFWWSCHEEDIRASRMEMFGEDAR